MTEATRLPEALMLLGPTATGKTDIALKLAQEFPIEIISVDSALVYRGMDIGTAKPTNEERQICPHHLIDILEPTETYSVANFMEDAEKLIQQIRERNKIPLLVGGTMLYAKGLLEGLAEMPSSTPEIKEAMRKRIEKNGLSLLFRQLEEVDPYTAVRLSPNDTQRISRAMEVYELTGRPLSSFYKETKGIDTPIAPIGLMPEDRKALHERIAERFVKMIDEGFIEEVSRLRQIPRMDANLPSMRCVGYRQAWQYLDGLIGFEEFKQAGIAATRQLAKRQMTWLRSMKNVELVPLENDLVLERLRFLCRQTLSTLAK